MALWTPAEDTVALWLRSDDNDTVAGQWSDKSGNNRHAVQATSTKKPTITAAGLNDMAVMTLDGGDYMITPNIFTAASDVTVFIVHKATTIDSVGNGLFALQNGLNNTNGYLQCQVRSSFTNKFRSLFTTDSNSAGISNQAPSAEFTTNAWRVTSHARSATAASFGINGVIAEIAATGQCNFANAKGIVGCYYSEGYEWFGQIAEIIVIPRYLSEADRKQYEGYIHWFWGLQANLPADHPYKAAAPTIPDATVLSVFLAQPYNLTDPLAASLIQPYSLAAALSSWLEQPYSFLLQAYLIQHYGDARQLRAWLIQKYRDVPVLRAWLEQKYGEPLAISAWLEQPWQMSADLVAWLAQRYGIAAGKLEAWLEEVYSLHENPQLIAALLQPYLIGDQERVTHQFDYAVSIGGVAVSPHVINWDFRRSRYYGTIELTLKLQDEALLAVDGVELMFAFGGTTYSFVIEGGWEETSGWAALSYRVAAHSRTKLLGAPHAAPITGQVGPGMASTVFAALVAPYGITLSYEITDVYLDAIEAEDETPIDLIRRILPEQAVLQSGPEGDVLYVQWETEVPVPQWFAAAPAATIDDLTGFVQTSETSDPQQGYNRFDIVDQQTAEDYSQLDQDQVDDQTIEVRLYLSPWDDDIEFELIHTAGSHVTIEPFGVTTRNETETVEFVDGAGRTRHPIDAVISTAWKQQALGAVTADADGILTAASKRTWDAAHETYTGGDSLLAITYRTRFWRWLVRSPQVEEVQVVALRVIDEGVAA